MVNVINTKKRKTEEDDTNKSLRESKPNNNYTSDEECPKSKRRRAKSVPEPQLEAELEPEVKAVQEDEPKPMRRNRTRVKSGTFMPKKTKSFSKELKLVQVMTEDNLDSNQHSLFLVPLPHRSTLLGAFYDERKRESVVVRWRLVSSCNLDGKRKISLCQMHDSQWCAQGKVTDITMLDEDKFSVVFINSHESKKKLIHMNMIPIISAPVPQVCSVTNMLSSMMSRDISVKYEAAKCATRGAKLEDPVSSGWLNCVGRFYITHANTVATTETFVNESDSATTELNEIVIPNEKILGVNGDKTGHILYVTTDKGNIYGYDLRCDYIKKSIFSINIGPPIYQVEQLVNNENLVIVSGYNNLLASVDLRAENVVMNYPNHDNEMMKIKFSVDEAEDVLSSAGESGYVRLWSLKNGQMYKEIEPPDAYEKTDFASTWFPSINCLPSAQISISQRKLMIYQTYDLKK